MKFILPEFKPNKDLQAVLIQKTSENVMDFIRERVIEWHTEDPADTDFQTVYRQMYERAVELGHYDELQSVHCNDVLLWPLPKPLQHKAQEQLFPVDSLPAVLKDYLLAVSAFGQVPPEMCALPMFSVLAMCTQGKAKVQNHKSSFTHELTLYTLTVAPSGARKSPALSYFMKAAEHYQSEYNERHELERKQRQTERQYKEHERQSALKGNKKNLERAKEIDAELLELPELRPLSLTVTDVTPEALAQAMSEHGGKMAVMDSEGGVLGTVAGLYNGGVSNIDLLLKAYDGDFVEIRRKTSGTVTLTKPLLTIGLLTQPKKFNEFISNPEFEEKGLLNRFLFSFPKAPARYTDTVPEIPEATKRAYYALIDRLLSMPDSETVIKHDRESSILFHDLHEHIQDCKQSGGIFEHIPAFAEKQHANALKIAALLHLCEHSPEEPINGKTAQAAINITMWAFNMAIRAFDRDINEDPVISLAYRIIEKMYTGGKSLYSLRDLYKPLHVSANNEEFIEALGTLIDCYYIQDNGKKLGEKGYLLALNPIIKPVK